MNTAFNQKQFKSLIKAARIFSIIAKWLFIVTGGVALIAFIVGLYIPKDFMTFKFSALTLHRYLDFQLEAYLSENILIKEVTLSSILLAGGLFAVVGSLFSIGLFVLLNRIFIQVEAARPFSQEVIGSMRLIAFGFMVAGVVIPIFEYLFLYSLVSQIDDALHASYNLDLGFIMIGALVYIIMRIFEYGAYLQNQYDETV
ncbi:MAG: hypothetical protein ACOC14_02450 [Bacillota bacterium]